MEIRVKGVEELTDKEFKACLRLNLGRLDGWMYESLTMERHEGIPSKTIMVWEDEKLLGWALLTPTSYYGSNFLFTTYARRVSKYGAQFYVRASHRKKGIGRMLMEEVQKLDPRPYVYPWSEASSSLFADYNVATGMPQRRMINKEKKRKRRAA